jgi:uncharacterized protein (TIGR01619 family)
MREDWNSYFCNVNDVLASIFLNLDLRESAPDKSKPNLLWVWVDMRWPREDGLSSSSEFDVLCAIEDKLTDTMLGALDAVFCGRITTAGRREFYFYGPRSENLRAVVEGALGQFPEYEVDCGSKADPEWEQYLNVLYPSEEDRQRMENRKVLDVLEKNGDALKSPRDIWHWIYFCTETDRNEFRDAVVRLQYRTELRDRRVGKDFPFGLCVVRFQSIDASEVDDAVIELYRLSKKHRGDYDGWETQVISQ